MSGDYPRIVFGKPWWLRLIIRNPKVSVTWNRVIYLADGIKPGTYQYQAIVAHETTHWTQQASMKWVEWLSLYLLSKRFRKAMELSAYRVQIAYMRSKQIPVDAEGMARDISGLYYGIMNYSEALEWATKEITP